MIVKAGLTAAVVLIATATVLMVAGGPHVLASLALIVAGVDLVVMILLRPFTR